MLRNVLDDYLNTVKERAFDYPLTSLLQAMGFYDIHLTDGGREYGKDFIAKRVEDGVTYQYAIQSKRGDIKQLDFRNKIIGQLLEAVVLRKLSHPQLDVALPQKTILVSTGELIDNAFIELREFNNTLESDYKKEKVEFWGKQRLIELSEEYGLSGIHQVTAKGLAGFAHFYLAYSKVLQGQLSDREIEDYSRFWLDKSLDYRKRILRAAIEADIIATHLVANGNIYEAITAYLSLARVIMQATYENEDGFIVVLLNEVMQEKISPLCQLFFEQIRKNWKESGDVLLRLLFSCSAFPMVNYLIWCSRISEITALHYFLSGDKKQKESAVSFLVEFIEKGFGRVHGDRYAVSLIWSVLALVHSGMADEAAQLVKRSTIWLCDRTIEGFGLARYEADEYEETATLLGYSFDFIKATKNRSSFLATALVDLAAFIDNKNLYADLVNDLEASEIVYTYWQFPDTQAIFTVDTEECRTYANIPHKYSLSCFEDTDYSAHMKDEPATFQITKRCGWNSLLMLSLLLKDRYFPKVWRDIMVNS